MAAFGNEENEQLTSDEEDEGGGEGPEAFWPEHQGPPMPTTVAVPTLETLMKVDDELLKRNLFEKGLPSEAKRKQELCEYVRSYWALKPIAMTPPVQMTPEIEASNNNQFLVKLLKERRGVSIGIFMRNKKIKALLTTTDLWELRLAAASRARAPRQFKPKEYTKSSEVLRRENTSLRGSLVAQDAMISALRAEVAAIRAQNTSAMYGRAAFR